MENFSFASTPERTWVGGFRVPLDGERGPGVAGTWPNGRLTVTTDGVTLAARGPFKRLIPAWHANWNEIGRIERRRNWLQFIPVDPRLRPVEFALLGNADELVRDVEKVSKLEIIPARKRSWLGLRFASPAEKAYYVVMAIVFVCGLVALELEDDRLFAVVGAAVLALNIPALIAFVRARRRMQGRGTTRVRRG